LSEEKERNRLEEVEVPWVLAIEERDRVENVRREETKGSESWCLVESGVEDEGEKNCEKSRESDLISFRRCVVSEVGAKEGDMYASLRNERSCRKDRNFLLSWTFQEKSCTEDEPDDRIRGSYDRGESSKGEGKW